jgi:hypothetical protein
MKPQYLISLALLFVFQLNSCTQSDDSAFMNGKMGEFVLDFPAMASFTTDASDLKQSEIDGLLMMREEEKMAHDVYQSFYASYGLTIFDRISNSETRHTEAVLALIDYFGLTDPALSEAGKFSNQSIQTLNNQLIAAGTSKTAALSTGAYIEEYDIADLKKLISEISNADILRVYTNLLEGSENHLRAFVRNLSMQGITYKPQILSTAEYNAIISDVNSSGAQNNQGRNRRN